MGAVRKHFFGEGLLKMFPMPTFLTMPATGIDITDDTVRFLSLKDTKEGKRIRSYGSYSIEAGVIKEGKIVDKGKLTGVLSKMRERHGIEFIHASLPEQQAYLFKAAVPTSALGKELETVLEFKLEENVPVSSKDLVFDYEMGEETPEETTLHVVAYPYETVSDYAEVFAAAGFKALSLETESHSLARAVIPRHHNGTYMIIDFGKMRTGIAIVSEQVVEFGTTLSIGGDMLTKAIQKHFNVTDEEADTIKNKKGFARYKENTELLETLISTVSVLRDEIRKHYDYWNTHTEEGEKKRNTIDKIILCGGGANLAGLPEYLSTDMNVVVEVADVWANTFSLNDIVPDITYHQSLAYAAVVGLALKGMD